jgi:hypothetical protein
VQLWLLFILLPFNANIYTIYFGLIGPSSHIQVGLTKCVFQGKSYCSGFLFLDWYCAAAMYVFSFTVLLDFLLFQCLVVFYVIILWHQMNPACGSQLWITGREGRICVRPVHYTVCLSSATVSICVTKGEKSSSSDNCLSKLMSRISSCTLYCSWSLNLETLSYTHKEENKLYQRSRECNCSLQRSSAKANCLFISATNTYCLCVFNVTCQWERRWTEVH